jgi:hypothetical protein
MGRSVAAVVAAAAVLVLAPQALAGGPRMLVGAVQQNLLQPTLQEANVQLDLAVNAGLGDVARVELTWARGRREPEQETVDRLRNAVTAAAMHGTSLYVALYPYGSSQTPLSDGDQGDFVAWATAIARAVPEEHHFIIGNEPNLNRFWLPQFGPNGENVAAPAYVSLLAKSYDALKSVSDSIEVLGGALSHAGIDRPGSGRDTHSPTAFIRDMGAAYRGSGRDRPIMDAFTFHPYMLSSDEPPTLQHPDTSTITIADYGKLVQLLGEAFDGTAQKGSTLPILYAEFGVESLIPGDKEGLYHGAEPKTIRPVSEATQATFYRQALELAFCQPNVRGFLVFSLIDETARPGWQSGVYYANGTPKSSLAGVQEAASLVRRNAISSCAGIEVTPRLRLSWFPSGRPGPVSSTFPFMLTCDVDCVYTARLERLPRHSTTRVARGRGVGRQETKVEFSRVRLAPGRYRLTIVVAATQNVGPSARAVSPPFTIPRA